MKIILILLALLGLFTSASAEDVLPADAIALTRMMGNGINLGNTMEACNGGALGGSTSEDPHFYETMWGQPVTTPEMLMGMKAAGFDSIRIPVAWMTNATRLSSGDYTISHAYLARVKEIVDYARDADMIVILNDHWDGGWYGMFGSDTEATRSLAMEAYTGMWRQIAEYFADYDWHLIFESANEELGARFDENSPLYCQDSITHTLPDSQRYSLTNEVNQAFVDTVRSSGGHNNDRFLLIAGFGTNIDQTFDARFRMPEDTAEGRLLISVHYYDPWSYCGATSSKGATLWGKQKDFETMYATLAKMKKFTAAGYGVVIGEYGALPGNDGTMKANATAYHKAFLDCCDALDYTSCLWDCSGFFVRNQLKIIDEEMASVYAGRNVASEQGRDYAEIATAGKASLDATIAAAPETLVETVAPLSTDTAIAWIMFSEGSWSLSYSVGDTYTPDSISPGIVPTNVEITGEGTYTVALDFTGTEKGYADNTAFSAVGISNGEQLYPGYSIFITEIRINGEPVKLKGRNYTCSDDGKCTRSNLFNEWVDMKSVTKATARVMHGDLTGISATILDRSLPSMSHIETLEVDFRYGP